MQFHSLCPTIGWCVLWFNDGFYLCVIHCLGVMCDLVTIFRSGMLVIRGLSSVSLYQIGLQYNSLCRMVVIIAFRRTESAELSGFGRRFNTLASKGKHVFLSLGRLLGCITHHSTTLVIHSSIIVLFCTVSV